MFSLETPKYFIVFRFAFGFIVFDISTIGLSNGMVYTPSFKTNFNNIPLSPIIIIPYLSIE
jgi:hypothetical protein